MSLTKVSVSALAAKAFVPASIAKAMYTPPQAYQAPACITVGVSVRLAKRNDTQKAPSTLK